MARRLINEAQLLAELPGLSSRQLAELRYRKKIPFYSPTYRLRLYDLEAVLNALARFETLAGGGPR
jgi:hypothetical protein